MILGAYVRVEIEGKELSDIVLVDRQFLRDGKRVWVMTPDGKLDMRAVEIVWGDSECVCVAAGLEDGDLLITSNLAAPVQGMSVRDARAEPQGLPGRPAGTPPETRMEDISDE